MATLKNNELVFGWGGAITPNSESGQVIITATKPSGTNVNYLTAPGFWEVLHPVNGPNPATSSWDDYYTILVIRGGADNTNYFMQIAFKIKTTKVWMRYCDGGTWSAWTALHS